jgi:hypothetical protein
MNEVSINRYIDEVFLKKSLFISKTLICFTTIFHRVLTDFSSFEESKCKKLILEVPLNQFLNTIYMIFWDFLGGEGAYAELLNYFEQAGIELRPEIDKYFEIFNTTTK